MPRESYVQVDREEEEQSSRRRGLLKTIGASLAVTLAGCQSSDNDSTPTEGGEGESDGGSGGDSDLIEVHPVEFMGPPSSAGVEHRTARFAAESALEASPVPGEYAPTRYSRMIERAWYNREYSIWYSQLQATIGNLSPYKWGSSYDSSFDQCAGTNVASIENDLLDERVEEMSTTTDRDQRQELVHQFFDDVNRMDTDVPFTPYIGVVHPMVAAIYNSRLFEDPVSVAGLGFKCYQCPNQIRPKTDMTTLVTIHRRSSPNFNPFYSGYTNLWAQKMIYDPLMLLEPDGETISPHVATNWEESDDGTTITIDIRDDVTWHDGEPLTAEDVAFTYPTYDKGPWFRSGVQAIESTEALDETTVEIDLETPWAPIYKMAFVRIPLIPKHIWEPIVSGASTDEVINHPAWQEGDLIGSGPFEFENWQQEESATLVATDDHFTGGPNVDEVIMNVVGDADAMLRAIRTEEAHLIVDNPGANPDAQMSLIEENDHLDGEAQLSSANHHWICNVDSAPVNFDAIRAAISACTPRRQIIEEQRGPGAAPGYDTSQPVVDFWHNDDKKMWDLADDGTEAAEQILEDAGFTIQDGTLYYPEGEAPDSRELNDYGC